MKNNFLKAHPDLRRMIRLAEIVIVTILVVYAALTYRELKILRATPVILPAYWFNVATVPDQIQRVQVRGSWVSKDVSPEFLHTTTIECVKSRMQCVESSAVVAVNEGGFLESVQTVFDVESWTENEIRTKEDVQPCVSRTLMLDLANKLAQSVVKNNAENKSCKAGRNGEQTFKLVAGQQAHAEAVKKAKPF
jgi:hypothetical protein